MTKRDLRKINSKEWKSGLNKKKISEDACFAIVKKRKDAEY